MKGKSDIVEQLIAAKAYETKADAQRAVDNVVDTIKGLISKKGCDGVSLVGFGSFKKVKRKARQGHNPATGEKIKIAASTSVNFKVSKAFKDTLK